MMFNPYTNRGPIRDPESFFGRIEELSQLYDLISQQQFTILTGERRVGKSSILNALEFERERFGVPDDLVFVRLDGQYFGDADEEDFLDFLLERIAKETGVGLLPPTRDSLHRISQALIRQPRAMRLVIVIDEIDVLARNPRIPPKLFSALRAWAQEYRVPFVVATREGYFEQLLEAQGSGSPFWNLFKPIYVGPLQRDDAVELVTRPTEYLEDPRISFTRREVAELLSLGGYQPFFLQMACDHMFQIKVTNPDRETDWVQLRLQFKEEATPHFDYLWDHLQEAERTAMVALVLNGKPPDVAIRWKLRRKGVLIDESQSVRVFSSGLDDFVKTSDQLIAQLSDLSKKALLSFVITGMAPDRKTRIDLVNRGLLRIDQEQSRLSSPVLADVIRFRGQTESAVTF